MVWPVNIPAVSLWRLLWDQWTHAVVDGRTLVMLRFDMATALGYAQEWARQDQTVSALLLVADLRLIADEVMAMDRDRRRR